MPTARVTGLALSALIFLLAACGTASPPAQAPSPSPTGVGPDATSTPPPTATTTPSPSATPAPTATATSLPSPTAAPIQEPGTGTQATPESPASNGVSLPPVQELGQEAMSFLTQFTEEHSPRASASNQEGDAADYLSQRFQSLGYEVNLQPFDLETLPPDEPLLEVTAPESREVEAVPLGRTGFGEATGELVHIGMAFPEDIPQEGLEGDIALIQRGEITFGTKVARAADAGAAAAVIYNNEPGLFRGVLGDQGEIPAVGISQESGQELLGLLESGPVEVSVSVVLETRQSRNVIAEKPGAQEGAGVVVVGAHYDTVPGVPGANDNGSGVAVMMTVAEEIADESYPFTVRFVAFGAEEIGLFGSRHYVDALSQEERESIIAMLNFDALGSGAALLLLGNMEQVPRLQGLAQEAGIPVERQSSIQGGTSDHAPFREAGIPFVSVLGDDFSRIHTPQDRLEFVQPEFLGGSAALGLALLEMLARE